jgi:hypothetical protein
MANRLGSALQRRVAPSASLTLEFTDRSGAKTKKKLELAFDFNAGAHVEELTRRDGFAGYKLTDMRIWTHITEPILLRAMFWASLLAHQPEYATPEGLEIVGSYMDESNQAAVIEALENAYLLYLPKEKREWVEEMRAAELAGEKPPPDPTAPSAEGTASSSSSSGPSPDTTSASA